MRECSSVSTELMPVEFTPPVEQAKSEPEEKPDDSPPPPDAPTDAPQVIPVVAMPSPDIAFSVPVKGTVAISATAAFAPPPPAVLNQQTSPSHPVQFNPNVGDGGSYPAPKYPPAADRNGYKGTVMVEIKVDASGAVTSANLQTSSGYSMLDEAALQVVKNQWRFPPGGLRWFVWPCIFKPIR